MRAFARRTLCRLHGGGTACDSRARAGSACVREKTWSDRVPLTNALLFAGSVVLVATGPSRTVPWTGCAPRAPALGDEPRSPGAGVTVPEAGAPPAGAPPQGWKHHPLRRFA
jgi:hypothetical protein